MMENATATATATAETMEAAEKAVIRDATAADLDAVIELDAAHTGLRKAEYWRRTFAEYEAHADSHFLIAETAESRVMGFILGEVRAWEFGSEPCGWILTIGVRHEHRQGGIGTRLFDALCDRFRGDRVSTVRTMLGRDDRLNMAFFRSQGLMAGSFIELEMPLD